MARTVLVGWIATLGLAGIASAQGKSAVAVLQMDRTAQSTALGNGGASLSGLNALGVNPAGLYSTRPEVLTQYQQLPLQTNLALLGASYPFPSLSGTLGLSFLTLRSSDFDRRDEMGNAQGRFSTNDQVIGLHMSRRAGFDLPMTVGVSLKYLKMGIDERSADALAIDLGARYRLPNLPLSLGLSILNLGKGPRFEERSSPLPTAYVLSTSYRLLAGLDVMANFSQHAAEDRQEFNVGMQYWIGDLFAVRGSYATARDRLHNETGLENLAAGIGMKILGRHMLDYTFQPFDSSLQAAGAAGTHLMTLTIGFADHTTPVYRPSLLGAAPEEASKSARQLMQEGIEAVNAGRFALATMRFGQASDAEPDNRQLRRLLPRMREVSETVSDATSGEAAAPHVRRGAQLYVYSADIKGAVQALRKAWNEEPSNDRVLQLLNRLEVKGQLDVTQKTGERSGVRFVEQKIAAARRAILDQKPTLAIKRSQEALSVEPKNLVALQLLGSAYYLLGDRVKARQMWRLVVKIDPANQEVAAFLSGDER